MRRGLGGLFRVLDRPKECSQTLLLLLHHFLPYYHRHPWHDCDVCVVRGSSKWYWQVVLQQRCSKNFCDTGGIRPYVADKYIQQHMPNKPTLHIIITHSLPRSPTQHAYHASPICWILRKNASSFLGACCSGAFSLSAHFYCFGTSVVAVTLVHISLLCSPPSPFALLLSSFSLLPPSSSLLPVLFVTNWCRAELQVKIGYQVLTTAKRIKLMVYVVLVYMVGVNLSASFCLYVLLRVMCCQFLFVNIFCHHRCWC